jgi:hypothetical protein
VVPKWITGHTDIYGRAVVLLSCLHVDLCYERSAEIRMPPLIVYENMRLIVRLLKKSARKSFRSF